MNKSIVVYYTWAGHTRKIAAIIAAQLGAELHEVLPDTPYTQNYNALLDQAKNEIREGFHPPINKFNLNINDYDVVFVGTPIWWGTMAPPIASFLSENDLSGKIVMPFSTHGGGGKGYSGRDIAKLSRDAKVCEMYTNYGGSNHSTETEIAAWIKKNITESLT